MMNPGEPKILLDCDVFIHFLKGGRILELFKIFPGRFVMLDKVKKELLQRDSNHIAIALVLAQTDLQEVQMPTDNAVLKEYFSLKGKMDDGEAACLSVARFNKEYVASSNITQVGKYCLDNGIRLYTTMDLLHEACLKGIICEGDCNAFIQEVRSKNSKLPDMTLKEYRKFKNIL